MHIEAGAETLLLHTVFAKAAFEADVTQEHGSLFGEESDLFTNAGCVGAAACEENQGRGLSSSSVTEQTSRNAQMALGKALEESARDLAAVAMSKQ